MVDRALLGALLDMLTSGRRVPELRLYQTCFAGKKSLIVRFASTEGRSIIQEEYELAASEIPAELRCALASNVISTRMIRTKRHAHTHEGLESIHWIPLSQDAQQFGCLELRLRRTLTQRQLASLEGIIHLFCNYLALLSYSQVDSLTGLLNRKTFDENLHQLLNTPNPSTHAALERRQDHTKTYNWLAVIDLDFFKRINDAHGHLAGDQVLIAVADTMRATFRRRDKLFRFGGEEFIVTLRNATQVNAVKAFERFRYEVETRQLPVVGSVTVSLGATRVREGDNPTLLLERADRALYLAKRNGRNRIEVHDDSPTT